MLCDDCKKRPACVHITKIINNQKMERHLCEHCAQGTGEISFTVDSGFTVQDLLKGMFSHGMMEGTHYKPETACPNCGMTYSDFSHNGKIGCSICYATFADRLKGLFRRIHGANAHTGKVPRRTGGALALKQKIKRLKHQLEQYVAREEFENAAKARDEIKALEKELPADGEGRLCQ